MESSILNSVKKVCSVGPDDTSFDEDFLMYINEAFDTLQQLGIGPSDGFEITDAAPTWSDYIHDDPRYNSVKSYVTLKTRMKFDPPSTSYHLSAMKEQIQELEWRLNVRREEAAWVPPLPVYEPADGLIDGGEL